VGKGQDMYPFGDNMCTTAALHMCIELLQDEIKPGELRNLGHMMRHVMVRSSKAHAYFEGSVPSLSVLLDKTLPTAGFSVEVGEYVICEEYGCKEFKDGYPTSYLISGVMLAPCLRRVQRMCTAIMTCKGHSVCVWREGEHYGAFDSFPCRMTTGMTLGEFDELLNRFITGQCDVTLLSREIV
jgi:hypothetical protein